MADNVIIVEIKESDAYPAARKRFAEICAGEADSEASRQMIKAGRSVREDGLRGIHIRAALSCDEGTYMYVLTVGECLYSGHNPMGALYADVWGTAYLEAATELMRDCIEQHMQEKSDQGEKIFLSKLYGPGYFGMGTDWMRKIFDAVDATRIGVRITADDILLPQKSSAGIYYEMKGGGERADTACSNCTGNKDGCIFCCISNKFP